MATGSSARTLPTFDSAPVRGVAAGAVAFVGLGLLTGLIPNPVFARMVPRTLLDFLFLTGTALFAGLYVFRRARTRSADHDSRAVGGVVGGLLAFGCPVCNGLLVGLFGSSAVMTYFDPLRPVVGVAALAVLAGSVRYVRRSTGGCSSGNCDANPASE